MEQDKTSSEKQYNVYAAYAVFFAVLWGVIYSYFAIEGKSLLFSDGLEQHLMALAYYGKYLRSAAVGLFTHGQIEPLMWDWTIGYGADVITTLHYYCFGDMLAWISAFVPMKYTLILYNVLIFLRMLLCGISFLIFCRYHKAQKTASLCGALVYAFCGFNLYCAVRHPYFTSPMIFLPLLCIGVDRIITEKKPVMFAITVFIACASNFYFFYMVSILVFIYAIVRYFFTVQDKGVKTLLPLALIALGAYAIGVMLAAPIFFPQIAGFLSSSRVGDDKELALFYRLNYYIKLIFAFVSPVSFDAYTLLGFAAPSLPLFLCVLCGKDKTAKQMCVFTAILIAFLIFPYFGHMFNGFNYVSNRWTFAVALPVSYAVAVGIPIVTARKLQDMRLPFAICAALCAIVFAASVFSKSMRTDYLAAYIVLAAFLAVLFLQKKRFGAQGAHSAKVFILAAICLSIIANGTMRYNRHFWNYINAFRSISEARYVMDFVSENTTSPTTGVGTRVEQLSNRGKQTHGIKRIDTFGYPAANSPAVRGEMGTTYYWAQSNDSLFRFFGKFLLGSNMSVRTIENRAALKAFLSIETDAPPFGFTYNNAIKESDVLQLPPLEKQDALLRYAVIDDEVADSFGNATIEPSGDIKTLHFDMTQDDGIQWKDKNHFVVTKNDVPMHLVCDTVPNTGTYIEIDDLRRIGGARLQDDAQLIIEYDGAARQCTVEKASRSWGHDFMMLLGHSKDSHCAVSIQFCTKGEYSVGALKLYSLAADYEKDIAALSGNALRDASIGMNTLSANITVTGKQKVLCMTIPYSMGWKAKVDGLDAPVFRVQYGFTGMVLDAGEHIISLRYKTPLFTAGVVAAIAGWLILIVYLCVRRKSRVLGANGTGA